MIAHLSSEGLVYFQVTKVRHDDGNTAAVLPVCFFSSCIIFSNKRCNVIRLRARLVERQILDYCDSLPIYSETCICFWPTSLYAKNKFH